MKLHRFYVEGINTKAGKLVLDHHVWVHDKNLLNQWLKVLRFKEGDQLTLFNDEEDRVYRVAKIEYPDSVLLQMITQLERQLPNKHLHLFWSSLKKDNNDWVVQKATELGVTNFIPLICDRSEKTGFNLERAQKIAIEAVEQCGRSDIPKIRQPIHLKTAFEEYGDIKLIVCEQGEGECFNADGVDKIGVLVGPEGGWSEAERELFEVYKPGYIRLSNFTLRAETAAVVASAILLQK